jgi:hypothetical protein
MHNRTMFRARQTWPPRRSLWTKIFRRPGASAREDRLKAQVKTLLAELTSERIKRAQAEARVGGGADS